MADGPVRGPLQVHVVADLIEVDSGLFQVGLQLPVLFLHLFLAADRNGGARINEPHYVVVFEPHQHQAAPAGGAAAKRAGGVRHIAIEFLLRFAERGPKFGFVPLVQFRLGEVEFRGADGGHPILGHEFLHVGGGGGVGSGRHCAAERRNRVRFVPVVDDVLGGCGHARRYAVAGLIDAHCWDRHQHPHSHGSDAGGENLHLHRFFLTILRFAYRPDSQLPDHRF